MEEVWGEVDHKFNYPHPSKSLACREQIRALARATSAATRLVDAIFATSADFEAEKKRRAKKRAKMKRA
jgi:putative GTP pyrophosphokinase